MPNQGPNETKVRNGNPDDNAKGVMVFTDVGEGVKLYYIHPEDLKKFEMQEGTPGYGEGAALVKRNVILSVVSTTDVPVGSFSTLVNVAALNRPKR